jgi:DNA-binding NtrC family response regulator
MNSRVLIVDDEPLCRHGLCDVLRREGVIADAAGSGDEAMRLYRRGDHRLVISDLAMPGLDGLGLLKALKREVPAPRFVLMTGVGTVSTAVTALREGADDVVEKPLSRERVRALLEALAAPSEAREILTRTPSMQALLERVRRIAATDATVLIQGESGTGKEMVAASIHAWSSRRQGPFVALNCAAMPDTLVEAELFGHERGAFTDARAPRAGVIEQADGGTLFLDEIGEMAQSAQAKLLRVLQDRSVRRLGGSDMRSIDVRFIAASNRSLWDLVGDKRFREDLYFRLDVVAVDLPSLRERPDDIPLLAEHFAARWARVYGRPQITFAPGALERLRAHPWPGNVRELENAVHRAVIEADATVIEEHHLTLARGQRQAPAELAGRPWEEVQRELIFSTLAQVGGNRRRAAQMMGIAERTLRNRLREYREATAG